jgi:hypothetical protein
MWETLQKIRAGCQMMRDIFQTMTDVVQTIRANAQTIRESAQMIPACSQTMRETLQMNPASSQMNRETLQKMRESSQMNRESLQMIRENPQPFTFSPPRAPDALKQGSPVPKRDRAGCHRNPGGGAFAAATPKLQPERAQRCFAPRPGLPGFARRPGEQGIAAAMPYRIMGSRRRVRALQRREGGFPNPRISNRSCWWKTKTARRGGPDGSSKKRF